MVIGHYMHGLWASGGVATYVRRVSQAQRGLGHQVVFFDSLETCGRGEVLVHDGSDLVEAATRAGVDVLHLHIDPPGGFPGGVPAVRTVHGHHPYCPSGTQFLEARGDPCDRVPGTAVCTWSHLVDRCGSRRPRRVVEDLTRIRVERRSGRHVTYVAPSEFVRNRLIRSGYDAGRIQVLLNPAPPQLPAPAPAPAEPPVFLFVGRMVTAKGLAWLLHSMARTAGPWGLTVLGEGPEEAEMRRLATRLALAGRVRFEGWQEEQEVLRHIARSRAVVVPSIWHEPAGLAAIEGAMMGRATIASAVGGLQEIVVPGITGFVVPPGDVTALTAAIDRLGADPAMAEAHGIAARERALRLYALDGHVKRLSDVYEAA